MKEKWKHRQKKGCQLTNRYCSDSLKVERIYLEPGGWGKDNEQRDKKQEERENNYQSVIEKLTEKYQILYTVQNDLNEIKNHLLAKQDSRSE